MGNRLTYEDVRKRLSDKGFTLISTEYRNAHSKLGYKCPEGHYCEATLNSFNNGGGCLTCSGKTKYTIPQIKSMLYKEGYILLSDYKNARVPIKICCPKNHVYEATLDKWVNHNRRCPTCAIERNSGTNHYNYNPDLSDEERLNGRNTKENDQWRKAIYKRDGNVCRACGMRRMLHAHHLFNWSEYPQFRYRLYNGITLCENCHEDFHKLYGKKNNTVVQIRDYISSLLDNRSQKAYNVG